MNPLASIRRWRENARTFRFYFWKYRRYYLFGIGALVVVDGLEAIPPLLLKSAIDGITEMPAGPELRALLLKIVAAYMAIALVQGGMRFLWRKYIVRTSMMASDDMRNELFIHLSSMAPGFFQKKRVGDLVSLATNDIEAIRFSLGPGALTLFDALFYFIAIPPIMLWISPELALLSFVPLLVVPFFVRRMEGRIESSFREVQDKFSNLVSQCQEALGGLRIVKGAALEPFKEREFSAHGRTYMDANLRSARVQAGFSSGLEGILSASTAMIFLVGGIFVIQEKITLGVFVAFQRYIQKLSWPMEGIGLAANIFQRSLASQRRVDEVMHEPKPVDPPLPANFSPSSVPKIELRRLSFSYAPAVRPVLLDISLTLEPGMRVGIAGGIGAGKTTLLACLARMLPAPEGSIFFDGADVNALPLTAVRRKIAFVPQESFLFSRSVEDNILYGCEGAPEQRLEQARVAAQLASVDKDVLGLPQGYQTLLGERGVNLSGGQRQRLTIARAIARKPRVLLLDDCLSAVDAETEHHLIDGILRASEGITLVVASHRVSTFHYLDWLVVLEAGRLVAQGKPKDLLRTNATLASLVKKEQAKEMDLL